MAEALIGKRHFRAFLSHAHVDKNKADALFHFLNDVANIPVWYDAVNLPPGATIAENLFEAIENSRAAIILLSQQSIARGWVQQESGRLSIIRRNIRTSASSHSYSIT